MVTDEQWEQWAVEGADLYIALSLPEEAIDDLLAELAEAVDRMDVAYAATWPGHQLALALSAAVQLKLTLDEAGRLLAMLRAHLGPPEDDEDEDGE